MLRYLQFVIYLQYNEVGKDGYKQMDNLYIIKDRLNEAMRLRGMNLSELAERSGLNKSSVSRYLSGNMIPRSNAIEKMAIALTVSPTWVLGYDVTMDGEEIRHIELDRLSDLNKEKIFAYYQALLDSQGGEDR